MLKYYVFCLEDKELNNILEPFTLKAALSYECFDVVRDAAKKGNIRRLIELLLTENKEKIKKLEGIFC